jgi:hypothetical protein
MWILSRRRPGHCKASASCAGQALRTGGALLIGAGLERSAQGIVASKQVTLIADAQGAVGELMDDYGTAYEVNAVASRRQLENQVFERNVLSLRTIRSCWLDSTSSNSMLVNLTKALSGWVGLMVKRRLKSGMKCCSR